MNSTVEKLHNNCEQWLKMTMEFHFLDMNYEGTDCSEMWDIASVQTSRLIRKKPSKMQLKALYIRLYCPKKLSNLQMFVFRHN